jgi:hypothetical protein
VVLRQGLGAEHDVALLEIFLPHLDHRGDARRALRGVGALVRRVLERLLQQILHAPVLEIADRDHDEVRGDVGLGKIFLQRGAVERVDALRRAENRPAERMIAPEILREDFVDEIVRRVLDHLDLFEDYLLLALDVVLSEQRIANQIGEDLDRQRQVLVQDLEVVAGVLLRREGVDLAADRIHLLGDRFR